MPDRNTRNLKELVYGVLNADAALQALLGGPGKVLHGNPRNKADYPVVTYEFLMEQDEPYRPDVETGIVKTIVLVKCFSTDSSSAQIDNLDDRVYELLHGQSIGNAENHVYSCFRTTRQNFYEHDAQVWRTQSTYEIVSVSK